MSNFINHFLLKIFHPFKAEIKIRVFEIKIRDVVRIYERYKKQKNGSNKTKNLDGLYRA